MNISEILNKLDSERARLGLTPRKHVPSPASEAQLSLLRARFSNFPSQLVEFLVVQNGEDYRDPPF